MRGLVLALFAAATAAASAAGAAETIAYTYDALGRLVQVVRSGTVNSGASESYSYDDAGNRTNVTVSPTGGGGSNNPSFSVNNVSTTEGGNLAFTVSKAGTTTTSFTVDYATANGTATAGSDYTAKSGTLTFAANVTTQTVSVATTDDSAVENAETVLLNLSNPSTGATISDSQGVGTINDNDAGGTNTPPVALNDTGVVPYCGADEFNVTGNDTDPDGDYPLVVTAVTGTGFSLVSSTTVRYANVPPGAGQKVGTYTVQDSRGATDTASLTITVPSGTCQ